MHKTALKIENRAQADALKRGITCIKTYATVSIEEEGVVRLRKVPACRIVHYLRKIQTSAETIRLRNTLEHIIQKSENT